MMNEYLGLLAGLTGIIAVIISLVTASSTAKRSAFDELERVVKTLRSELDVEKIARTQLQVELNKERVKRIRFEDWARRLVNQLEENHIMPEAFE